MFSKLTNSNCPLFSAFFTSIFIPPNPLYRILFLDKKKGHLPVTFFDRLKARASPGFLNGAQSIPTWSWRSDLNRRPADYEVYKSSPTGPKPAFLTVSATSALYLWRFSLHCFRPRLSACGSRCGSARKLFTGIWQIPFALDSDFAQQ